MNTYPDPAWFQALPPTLTAQAIFLAGEAAWLPDAALKVISWLTEAGYAVIGVELWEDCGGRPVWIATSNYEHDQSSNSPEYIKLNFAGATQFVERFGHRVGALFNLTIS